MFYFNHNVIKYIFSLDKNDKDKYFAHSENGGIMRRRLPVGLQDLANVRENNHVYVDKTEIIYNLIQNSFGACPNFNDKISIGGFYGKFDNNYLLIPHYEYSKDC